MKQSLKEQIFLAVEEEKPIEGMQFEGEWMEEMDISRMEFDQVTFTKCRFISCDFLAASFYDVMFINCEFSNCNFKESYWKRVTIKDCKADGSKFGRSSFRELHITGSTFCYANCIQTLWENCRIEESDFKESFLSEVKWKKPVLSKVNFANADFFKTPLKGIDLSDCNIDHIMMSDQYKEIAGAKINMFQAVELAKLLGVKVV